MANLLKKGLTKYKNLPTPVRASLWSMICIGTQKGITLLSMPIFTRLLTREQYGVFTVYQSWYTILVIFATLNLYGGVYNNGLLKYEKRRNEFTSSIQGLSTTVTFCLFIVYIVAAPFWNSLLKLSTLYGLFRLLSDCSFIFTTLPEVKSFLTRKYGSTRCGLIFR